MPGRPCSVAIRRAALNRLSLIQGGFDIGDGFEQIVGILLQLCECPYRLFRIDAQPSMIEKMGLPAGQHWSAATRSERIEAGRGLRVFCLGMDPRLFFQSASARHQSDNCEKEIGRLWRVGRNDDGLGVALGGDEAGVTPLPSFKLAVEKVPPRRLVCEREQMAIQPGEKAQSALRLV